jgi:hypothetical protein
MILRPAENICIAAFDVNLASAHNHRSQYASHENIMYNIVERISPKKAQKISYHEECITEYYRQECLLALYAKKQTKRLPFVADAEQYRASRVHHNNKRKRKPCGGVTFAETTHVVMGVADAEVDRTPVPPSKITRDEMMTLMAERVLPHTNIGHISRQHHQTATLTPSMLSMDQFQHQRNFSMVR